MSKVKWLFLFILVLKLNECSLNRDLTSKKEVVLVKSVGETPKFNSGLISTWVEINTKNKTGNVVNYYINYLNKNQRLPVKDRQYVFEYEIGNIDDLMGSKQKKAENVRILRSFVYCSTTNFSSLCLIKSTRFIKIRTLGKG